MPPLYFGGMGGGLRLADGPLAPGLRTDVRSSALPWVTCRRSDVDPKEQAYTDGRDTSPSPATALAGSG